jgi:hypothetical protein
LTAPSPAALRRAREALGAPTFTYEGQTFYVTVDQFARAIDGAVAAAAKDAVYICTGSLAGVDEVLRSLGVSRAHEERCSCDAFAAYGDCPHLASAHEESADA